MFVNGVDKVFIWAAPCKNVPSEDAWTVRPRSACESMQFDQGLHCPLPESLDTIKCISGEQRPGRDFEHAHDDLGPVVQSVVSLTSSFRVISLTVLADSMYNILIFFAEKM